MRKVFYLKEKGDDGIVRYVITEELTSNDLDEDIKEFKLYRNQSDINYAIMFQDPLVEIVDNEEAEGYTFRYAEYMEKYFTDDMFHEIYILFKYVHDKFFTDDDYKYDIIEHE